MRLTAMLVAAALAVGPSAAMPPWNPPSRTPGARPVSSQRLQVGVPGTKHPFPNQSETAGAAALSSGGRDDDDGGGGGVFGGQCRFVTLGGHGEVGKTALEGQCVDVHGQWWRTSLNLNRCIAAGRDGELIYQDSGNFDSRCRPCVLDDNAQSVAAGLVLKCNCLDHVGMLRYVQLRVGLYVEHPLAVKPDNGRFVCGEHWGKRNPVF